MSNRIEYKGHTIAVQVLQQANGEAEGPWSASFRYWKGEEAMVEPAISISGTWPTRDEAMQKAFQSATAFIDQEADKPTA